jgi:NNP family nitrate/nitrite transporter-like MFS transporter
VRPVGGRLADRLGGSRVTLWNFVTMAAGAAVVLLASTIESLPLFVAGFVSLFVMTGLGNGSTYKMIPAIFQAQARRAVEHGADADDAARRARRLSRALIGVAGAVGAIGGVLVNLTLRQSFLEYQSADRAYVAFMAFYLLCAAVTWAVYRRPSTSRLAGV